VYLTAGDTIRWPARHEPGRLAVDGLRSHVNAEQEWWMPDDALPGAEATGLDDLPVRLSFELGQFDLTLAELETLGPGHVFELNRGEADGVDIMANGKRIGAGRAITINGTLGVQIVRLGGS
jgi:type III secretion system YscQ/HrcQ family protein